MSEALLVLIMALVLIGDLRRLRGLGRTVLSVLRERVQNNNFTASFELACLSYMRYISKEKQNCGYFKYLHIMFKKLLYQ